MVKTWFWKIDHWLERHRTLVVLLALTLLLRLPSFFEPYWYGDEAIYLTIGNALKQGAVLYRDIIDNKTPLIYYFAQVGSQLNFRLLLTISMLVSTGLFYTIANKLIKKAWLVTTATLVFILVTTLPTFEGLIPNGELFGLVFILLGVWLTLRSKYLQPTTHLSSMVSQATSLWLRFTHQTRQLPLPERRLVVLAGISLGLAVMVKVPFTLDFLAVVVAGSFGILTARSRWHTTKLYWLWLLLGFGVPILLSLVWFAVQGALPDYLGFGLFYNLNYAQAWIPTSTLPLASFFASHLGKLFLLVAGSGGIAMLHKRVKLTLEFLFLTTWTLFALVGSTLSNRPYPHYVLHFVAPLVLLLTYTAQLSMSSQALKQQVNKVMLVVTIALLALASYLIVSFGWWAGRYPTITYFANWTRLITGQLSYAEYATRFDPLVADNLTVAPLIRDLGAQQLFIWGDNPMLYAQSGTAPVGKYTVLFHIVELDASNEVVAALMEQPPPVIVLMHTAIEPTQELTRFLHNNYQPTLQLSTQSVWRLR